MILFVDSSQIIHAEIEAVVRHFKENEGRRVILFGPDQDKLMLRVKMANYGADGILFSNEDDTLEDRIRGFRHMCEQYSVDPTSTRIVSNNGVDLAAAILLGSEFTWAFDIH